MCVECSAAAPCTGLEEDLVRECDVGWIDSVLEDGCGGFCTLSLPELPLVDPPICVLLLLLKSLFLLVLTLLLS